MSSDDESTSSASGSDPAEDDIAVTEYPAPAAYDLDGPPQSSSEDTSDTGWTESEPVGPVIMAARAYQLEMLEQSLKENTIVAMDTGSGKTQVAVLRIQAERSPKRVWFMAPTVVLVDQQLERIQEQMPNVICKRLCGDDNVDTWSSQKVWDAFLENVRTVVSPPDVLLRALQHGFVSITSLSLIVFDEAHNLKGNNSGARIMKEFYRPAKEMGLEVPHVLGLTASPIISRSKRDLDVLEATLDARCRAPKIHREELISHVNIPEMSIVVYGPPEAAGWLNPTRSMTSLCAAFASMDITEDPTILRLKADKTKRARYELQTRLEKHDTPAQLTMRSFSRTSLSIMEQLGPWAADFYIHRVVSDFLSANFRPDGAPINGTVSDDTRYLGRIFRTINAPAPPSTPTEISRKMQHLLHTLESCDDDVTGIVFAQERTTVVVVTHLLKHHPMVRDRFKVASVVGTSQHRLRKRDVLELSDGDAQGALRNFRLGKVNLLVATTVLEEGIDVPACNTVVCFEKPKTLKSFIQRRGRARMNKSKLILLLDEESRAAAEEWRALELEMKARYEDDARQIQVINEVEETEHPDYPPLEVEGADGRLARLTIDDAKAHLEHFCATLSSRKFVDFSPYYIIQTAGEQEDTMSPSALLKATVHLPVSLPPELRQAESLRAWRSEKNACKDAAFQAYRALYAAGLVNEHLLPLRESDLSKNIEAQPGITTVKEQLNPWPMVALALDADRPLDRRILRFADADGASQAEFDLLLPVPIPQLPALTLYWSARSAWTVSMSLPPEHRHTQDDFSRPIRNDMETLVTLAYGHRGARYAVTGKRHMLCVLSRNSVLDSRGIGAQHFDQSLFETLGRDRLIRDVANYNHPYFYAGWLPTKPPIELVRKPSSRYAGFPEDEPYVVVANWPKKTAYFHRPTEVPQPAITKPYHRVLPASTVKADAIPLTYARFAMCIPSLVHALEVYLVAAELLTQRLERLQLTDLEMVASAICTPAARMPDNYERMEFLGDCVLKLTATSNCLAHHPDWPEGLLSLMKDAIVSNSRLAKAALDFGLDRYIITKAPTQDKWKPLYVEDHLPASGFVEGRRAMSTKTLADVVEALVGVSYLSGGLPKALECVALFMPPRPGDKSGSEWRPMAAAREALYAAAPAEVALPPAMEPLEQLVGYAFRKKALLVEAMTHSSYRVPGTHACLERLEFLGDSILEYLVVRRLFAAGAAARDNQGQGQGKGLAHWQMHLLKTALVNADFLAFRAMEWSVAVARNEMSAAAAEEEDPGSSSVTVERGAARLPLWSFMRFSSGDLALAQRAAAARHAALREGIEAAMRAGDRYPWALLARLQAQKYYSDVFESLLGAVYVDSGSFDECDAILERAGILSYLERMLRDGVKVWHPKEELGRLAASEKVEYVIEAKESEEDDGVREFACRVVVGETVVAQVEGGVSREEVRTRAAEEAVRYYNALGRR